MYSFALFCHNLCPLMFVESSHSDWTHISYILCYSCQCQDYTCRKAFALLHRALVHVPFSLSLANTCTCTAARHVQIMREPANAKQIAPPHCLNPLTRGQTGYAQTYVNMHVSPIATYRSLNKVKKRTASFNKV